MNEPIVQMKESYDNMPLSTLVFNGKWSDLKVISLIPSTDLGYKIVVLSVNGLAGLMHLTARKLIGLSEKLLHQGWIKSHMTHCLILKGIGSTITHKNKV